jgi:hypothetical protein
MKILPPIIKLVNSLTRYKKIKKNLKGLEAKIVGEVKYDRHRDQTLRLQHRRMGVKDSFYY